MRMLGVPVHGEGNCSRGFSFTGIILPIILTALPPQRAFAACNATTSPNTLECSGTFTSSNNFVLDGNTTYTFREYRWDFDEIAAPAAWR
jgi:hypothetical protein